MKNHIPILFISWLGINIFSPKALARPASYVFIDGQFQDSQTCSPITKDTTPFYIVYETLMTPSTQLSQGSLVAYSSSNTKFDLTGTLFQVLKTTSTNDTRSTQVPLSLEHLDLPNDWNLIIHKSHLAPNSPYSSFNGFQLKVSTQNHKYNYKRCCLGRQCWDIPVFKVSSGDQYIMDLAFLPNKNDFITQYEAVKVSQRAHRAHAQLAIASYAQNDFPIDTSSQPSSSFSTWVQADDTSQDNSPTIVSSSPRPTTPTLPRETPSLTTTNSQPPLPPRREDYFNNSIQTDSEQRVVCTQSQPLKVYDDSLARVIYRVQRFQPVKVFQGWDGGNKDKMVRGHKLVRVQLQNARGKNINGWVAENYVKPARECKDMPLLYSKDGSEPVDGVSIVVDSPKNCCRFPTLKRPIFPYTNGSSKRYFGARRKNGQRMHAACDLIRPPGEKVFAIDGGKILRKYKFYVGTYAIEVKHDNGLVARYGEVSSRDVAQAAVRDRVIKGQHIGYIDHLKMLHFELYSDTVSGPLTQVKHGKYWRRSDLIDPTNLLLQWESATF